MEKRVKYDELLDKIDFLLGRIDELVAENKSLRKRLDKYEGKKNSNNSSMPPSQDPNRPKPNQSLRKASGKKPGGQKGRLGSTLKRISTPDEIVILSPLECVRCGNSLEKISGVKSNSRQIVDIPKIKAVFTEYQSYSKTCTCGCSSTAPFPDHIKYPVSYGENMEALISYFHARQYLPFARMKELFNDVFHVNISEGGIHCLLNRFARKTDTIYQEIKNRISESSVIGTDETGINVNKKKHWYWTWQTDKLTFISHSSNRGFATINKLFPEGFSQSILVHDGWKAQLKTAAHDHQTCIPHLLRRLNYLNERYDKNKWSVSFSEILLDALKLKSKMLPQEYPYSSARNELNKRLDTLLKIPPNKELKELYSFCKRMNREKEQLFTFLYNENVPGDNNASERAIRNVKVKQKISGQFKKEQTA